MSENIFYNNVTPTGLCGEGVVGGIRNDRWNEIEVKR